MKRSKRYLILLTAILALSTCKKSNNPSNNPKSLKTISTSESSVQIVGAMRNVMWKGQLGGVVQLDTLAKNRKGLYGLGPVEYLQGEILIYDGITLVSTVNDEENPVVKEIPQVSAPFFVYGHQDRWNSLELPETVHDIPSLEQFITSKTDHLTKPFVFKINATVEKAIYHIQDLPQGSIVRNPEEAHAGQKKFTLETQKVSIVGFYSKNHHGIFTHHDTNMHMHLITADKTQMGHLDVLALKTGTATLFLPDQ